MPITATGRLRHCWFGDYSAVIVLKFDNTAHALQAQQCAFPVFELLPDGHTLRFQGGGNALKHAEATLKAHGADMRKVGSLKFSIDYGEPFTVTVREPVHSTADNPQTQQQLF